MIGVRLPSYIVAFYQDLAIHFHESRPCLNLT